MSMQLLVEFMNCLRPTFHYHTSDESTPALPMRELNALKVQRIRTQNKDMGDETYI